MSGKIDEMNEEFNNFMYRVTEISEIVKKMRSDSKELQTIGQLEAEKYLKDNDRTLMENIDENNVKLNIKCDRTLINQKAFNKIDQDPNQMSQEAFMEYMEKDIEERTKSKKIRKEKAETFKVQANRAFKRGEYEKALNCYNKAIEQVKDSPLLYQNRALTYINLKLYHLAIDDCKTGLRFNESSLKSWLLLAKSYFLNGDKRDYDAAIEETKNHNPDKLDFIAGYIKELEEAPNSEH